MISKTRSILHGSIRPRQDNLFAEPSMIEKRLGKYGSTITPQAVTKIDIFKANNKGRNDSEEHDNNPL
jgi:hypothetical protein